MRVRVEKVVERSVGGVGGRQKSCGVPVGRFWQTYGILMWVEVGGYRDDLVCDCCLFVWDVLVETVWLICIYSVVIVLYGYLDRSMGSRGFVSIHVI